MDSMAKEFEKVSKKQVCPSRHARLNMQQKTAAQETIHSLESMIQQLTEVRNKLDSTDMDTNETPNDARTQVVLLASKVKTVANQMQDNHKELYNLLGKYAKTVEKRFKVDLDQMWNPKAFVDKEEILAHTIATHLIREGKFRVAETFVKETGIELPHELKEQFSDMFHILQTMHSTADGDVIMEDVTLQATTTNAPVDATNANFEPALDWVKRHTIQLDRMDSTLEFSLHKCRYLQKLRTSVDEAIEYSRVHLARFMADHAHEVQRLMGAILYRNRLATSPYAEYCSPVIYSEVVTQFVRDFCAMLGLPSEPPLQVAMQVGTLALPTLHKMSTIMKDKSGLEWSQQGELPVEIALVDRHRYHSIFACPVTKEAYSGGDENPPMMMVCGHVISKDALAKLSKNNPSIRFKCPYCPMESTATAAIRVYF